MLQAIRDRSKGLIAGFIVFLISLTFALVGVQGYLTGESDVVVAEVDGDEILLSQYQNRIQQLKRRTEELTGGLLDVNFWATSDVKKRTLDQLIDERILDKILQDRLITISDSHLVAQVREIDAFKEEGTFSRELYERMLDLNGMSVSSFEKGMRKDLMRSRLRAGLLGSEFVTEEESLFLYRLQNQKRDIGYTIVTKNQFSDTVKADSADINEYYEENKELFRNPERVSINYIDVSPEQLLSQIAEPDRGVVENFFNDRLDSYRISEKRKVEHLLLSNSKIIESIKGEEIVRSLLGRLRAGESTETILSESSEDYVLEGGTTDFFEKGMMTPKFENVVFALAMNEVSEPFTSQFGVHIAKLIGVEAGYTPELESVLPEVIQSYKELEAEELYLEVADRMSEMSYEDPSSLDATADALGLEQKETGLLTRQELVGNFGGGFANQIFEPDVLVEGLNSELVELEDGRLVVARVKLYVASEIPNLEKIATEVGESWRTKKEQDLAKSFGDVLLEGMRGGQSVRELAAQNDLTWEVQQAVDINDESIDSLILKRSFEINVLNNNPVYFGQELDNGDYAVVRVANVQTPSEDTITEGEAALAEEEMLGAQAAALWDDFSKAQRRMFDVKTYEDRL